MAMLTVTRGRQTTMLSAFGYLHLKFVLAWLLTIPSRTRYV